MKPTTTNKWIHRLTLVSIITYTLAFSLISTHRFRQYNVFYYDFGIFDRAIWQVAHFRPPVIDHMVVGGKLIFADHFSPGIYLLSPLYWFTNSQTIILIAQSLIVATSGYFIYLLARHHLKHSFPSLAITSCYLLFIGLQNALISDFHAATIATLPLVIIFYSIAKNKLSFFYLSLIVFLSFKESHFLLIPATTFYIWFSHPKWRRHALITLFLSLLYGYLTINHIIPFFSGDNYHYSARIDYHPIKIITAIINHPQKLDTIFKSLLSFGFLPLLSPLSFPLILTDWVIRFVPTGSEGRWGLGLHYSVLLAPSLAIASIHGLKNFQNILNIVILSLSKTQAKDLAQRRYNPSQIITLLLLPILLITTSFFLSRFYFQTPIHLAYRPAFYSHSKNFDFLDQLINQIPPSSSIMTQNNLASHFTHHQNVWLFNSDYTKKNPDYIVFDLRPGQNPNNFFAPLSPEHLLEKLYVDCNYQLHYTNSHQIIYKRI